MDSHQLEQTAAKLKDLSKQAAWIEVVMESTFKLHSDKYKEVLFPLLKKMLEEEIEELQKEIRELACAK